MIELFEPRSDLEPRQGRANRKQEVAVVQTKTLLYFRRTLAVRRVLMAVAAATAVGAFAIPATASAEYYWGCTYSWGSVCFAPRSGGVNYLVTMDPDHARSLTGGAPTQNGYPRAREDNRERDVCGAVWNAQVGQSVPWSCSWGQNVYTFPLTGGQGMIGTAVQYYGIALYQVIDYSENGP